MMNIKILNPIPENEVLCTLPFGSLVYGTATKNSDQDYIKIIKQNTGSLILQYVENEEGFTKDRIDYIYVGLDTFLQQAQDGSNVTFFEAMLTPEAQYLVPRDIFLSRCNLKRIARAYLGLAKRDIEYPERYHHVKRCYWFANLIMNNTMIELSLVKHLPDIEVTREKIKELRNLLR